MVEESGVKVFIVKRGRSEQILAAVGQALLVILDMTALASLQLATGDKLVIALLFGNVAGAAHVLLGILVVDEELALLAVAVGLVAGDGDNIEDAGCLLEDDVHFLQGAVCGLGVEEVDDWEDECVAGLLLDNVRTVIGGGHLHHGENDICPVFDVLKGDRRDHDNEEVENPGWVSWMRANF